MDNKEFMEKSMIVDRTKEEYAFLIKQKDMSTNMRLIHAALGLSGETGELVDCIKKHVMYKKGLDLKNLKEECGDILWYMSILLNEVGSDFDEIMEINSAKLSKRYPEGYSHNNAIIRLDKNS